MNRISLTLMLAAALAATIGCSSKNYVRQQTTPLINKTNELDDLTAKNSKEIKDVDQRAQAGIQGVQTKAAEVDQKALAAGKQADEAQTLANNATQRVDTLTNTVVNLDNYHSVADTSVLFGFNKDNLTKQSEGRAGSVGHQRHFHQGLHHHGGGRNGFGRPGGLQLRPEPAPRQLCYSVPGIGKADPGSQDLSGRLGQGQAGRVE